MPLYSYFPFPDTTTPLGWKSLLVHVVTQIGGEFYTEVFFPTSYCNNSLIKCVFIAATIVRLWFCLFFLFFFSEQSINRIFSNPDKHNMRLM